MAVSTQEVIIVNPAATSVVTVSGTAVGPQGTPGATGSAGVIITTSAPINTSIIWADPNDTTYTTLVDGGSA